MNKPESILEKFWKYKEFRPLQKEIIMAVAGGKDALALLPTGGGKSICFQVPALMQEGMCIVVSPLIALMNDQVNQLQSRGISAVAISSQLSRREIDMHLDNCVYGKVKFLYLSPERIQTDIFQERVKRMPVNLLAIDEAHCISQWGYDFRPSYLEISELRELIPEVPILALTATATPEVRKDIVDKLGLKEPELFVKSFSRPNLSYSVFREEDKGKKLLQVLSKVAGAAVVYVRSRKRTEDISKWLNQKGIPCTYYHAGINKEERNIRQEAWIVNKFRVIVATNAFGMGIDKADVRLVIHLDIPDSPEAYYQEAGRAGRDEQKAYALLLWQAQDIQRLRENLERLHPPADLLKKVYQALSNHYQLAVGSHPMQSFDFVLEEFCNKFNFQASSCYYALKKLEECGLIQLSENFFSPSRLMIQVGKEKLYDFQLSHPNYEKMIKALLRLYGGELFRGYLSIQEEKLAQLMQVSTAEVKKALSYLDGRELMEYLPRKEKPQLSFLTPRQDSKALKLDLKFLEARKKVAAKKVDAMIHYLEMEKGCRTAYLLAYFGEEDFDRCGICDLCLKHSKNDTVDHRKKILYWLEQGPLFPDELRERVSSLKKEELIEQIRTLLDEGQVKYDATGKLMKDH